ncbi:MAG: type IV pilin [Haloferacaceae archaeon]
MTTDRAQSEVIGNVLLVATVVVAVSLAGALYLGTIGTDEETLADVAASTANASGTPQVAFVHRGGESVANDTLIVRVWVDDSQVSASFNDTASDGDADGRFDPGDRRVYDVGGAAVEEGDTVRALLATNATNTVLVDERLTYGG